MDADEEGRRPSFFTYKVLEDQDILRRSSTRAASRGCCSCCSDVREGLPRCLKATGLCLLFTTSLFLSMAPWAMAITEAVVMPVLYVVVLREWRVPAIAHIHYSWWRGEEDVLLFSWLRALTALVSFFFGLGKGLHMPYLVVSAAFAAASVPYLAAKSYMLRHPLVGKHGVLLLACGLFSIAHVVVAMNVNLFARRKQQMGLLGQDEERQGLMQRNDGDNLCGDDVEVAAEALADDKSCFIDCCGLKLHYKVEQPQEERDSNAAVVLIHGFGAGCFAWRLIMPQLARKLSCRVYAFDRPGFGLTSRPLPGPGLAPGSAQNPYSLAFQANLVLELCRLWGCRRVVLAGHSDGALVAFRAAAEACRQTPRLPTAMPSPFANGPRQGPRPSGQHHSPAGRLSQTAAPQGEGETRSAMPAGRQSLEDPPVAGTTGSPSSPFSKWLQLGQPHEPKELRSEARSQGVEQPNLVGNELLGEERDPEAAQPSLALASASAAMGPARDTLSGISTSPCVPGKGGATAHLRGLSEASARSCEEASGRDADEGDSPWVAGVALLHPSLDGKAKPQIARVLSSSRVGRRILRRLLRSEIGEVANKRAWYDAQALTPEILRLYKAPLRVQGWEAGLIEASRLRREATEAQLTEYASLTAGLPKLLVTGAFDRLVPPAALADLKAGLGRSSRSLILPGCGHLSHEEAAPQLLPRLADFVQGCLWQ